MSSSSFLRVAADGGKSDGGGGGGKSISCRAEVLWLLMAIRGLCGGAPCKCQREKLIEEGV